MFCVITELCSILDIILLVVTLGKCMDICDPMCPTKVECLSGRIIEKVK